LFWVVTPYRLARIDPRGPIPLYFIPPPSTPYKMPPLPSSATLALKMETVCLSETLVSTRRHNPEQQHRHHRHENVKSQVMSSVGSERPCLKLMLRNGKNSVSHQPAVITV
jgi:hypothetical protein